MRNNLKVEFIPKNKEVSLMLDQPKPSKNYIPDWFKQMPAALADLDNKKFDETAKKCMPFLDSLTCGYTQELICDIEIVNHGENPDTGQDLISYRWAGEFKPLSTRAEDTRSRNVFPEFYGYNQTEFHWNSFWEPKTPKGYSTLYHHPSNRFDLPFTTMSGIIDTDSWPITGPVPFLIKKGFSGLIPAGTPIYQMIFIKRDSWQSEKQEYDERFNKKVEYGVRKFFIDGYKKQHWSRKDYS